MIFSGLINRHITSLASIFCYYFRVGNNPFNKKKVKVSKNNNKMINNIC